MSSTAQIPAVFRNLEGKVHPDVVSAIRMLFNGLQDHKQAIIALKGQKDTLQTQVNGVSITASEASTAAASANTQLAQPVAAGQTNLQDGSVNNPYITAQTDHLGNITLQGSGANVTLNSNVSGPFTTHLINQSSNSSTVTPDNAQASIYNASGAHASISVAPGADVHLYFDGFLTWIAA